MGASIADFLAMLATERGAARNTVLAYGRDLEQAEELIGTRLVRMVEEGTLVLYPATYRVVCPVDDVQPQEPA